MNRTMLVAGCLLLIAGCGSDDTTNTTAAAPTPTVAAKPTPKPKPTPVSPEAAYRAGVIDCLEGVAYKITTIGQELRVSSGGGRPISDISTFKTRREAQAFQKQLLVEGTTGGQGVATFLVDADARAKRVVTDCLTP